MRLRIILQEIQQAKGFLREDPPNTEFASGQLESAEYRIRAILRSNERTTDAVPPVRWVESKGQQRWMRCDPDLFYPSAEYLTLWTENNGAKLVLVEDIKWGDSTGNGGMETRAINPNDLEIYRSNEMTTHAVPPVKGYNPLTDEQVNDMNVNKVMEAEAMAILESLAQGDKHTDKRAIAIAQTKMQEAFMWANRAIAKPDGGN